MKSRHRWTTRQRLQFWLILAPTYAIIITATALCYHHLRWEK